MMTETVVIADIRSQMFNLPLEEPIQDAMHGLQTYFELVTVQITLTNGLVGVGYTYTIGRGGHAIKSMIDRDIAPGLIGAQPNKIDKIYEEALAVTHYVGRGGIAAFAISAIDIALWDIRGKRTNTPLWQMAGGGGRTPLTYRGGVDLNFPMEKLLASIDGHLSEGFEAIKIKIGSKDFREDVIRVAAVRERIGSTRKLMVDANYSYDLERAVVAARAFEEFDLTWLEEPLAPDDYAGYGALAKQTTIPLAMGENLHTQCEFELAYKYSAISFIQPDASNCGGVTGFLRAARAAATHGIPVCSHGMQELHVSLVAAQPNAGWVEVHSFRIDRFTTHRLAMVNGQAIAPNIPGTGVDFNWDLLAEVSEKVRA